MIVMSLISLCIILVYYNKAQYSIRTTGIPDACINILENIYASTYLKMYRTMGVAYVEKTMHMS